MYFPIMTALTVAVTLAASPTPRTSAPAHPPAKAAPGANNPSAGGPDLFKHLDQNGNARIEQAEWQTLQQSRFDRLDANHNGTLTGAEMEQQGGASGGGGRLARLDSNSDGAISKQEFVSGQLQMMQRLDKNQDGVLSKEEFARVTEAMAGRQS
jgi:hypothetical protein